jgi:hypothetical protein
MPQSEPVVPGQPVVSFQPVIAEALGGDADALLKAIVIHYIWSNSDATTYELIASTGTIARDTGMSVPMARRTLVALRTDGVLTSRRSGGFDSPYAWTVKPQELGRFWQ